MMEATTRGLDFACRCSEDGRTQCDELLQWAYEFLSNRYHTITAADFLTAFCYRMDGYRAQWEVHTDQWSAVVANTYDPGKEEGETFHTFVQCDRVEDGLAFTLRRWYDAFGEERPHAG